MHAAESVKTHYAHSPLVSRNVLKEPDTTKTGHRTTNLGKKPFFDGRGESEAL